MSKVPHNPSASSANEPPGRDEIGPRYESLVVYPTTALAGAEQKPDLDQAVDRDADDDAPPDSAMEDGLTRKLEAIPLEPGVYLLLDRNGKVLYIGKAKSLRPRVRSYFREGGDGRFQVRFLMRRVRDFETLIARSEKEALILENNLIKQYKPKFNVLLRDDKTYPYIRYTAFEKYPRVYVTRRLRKDGSLYFGPFFRTAWRTAWFTSSTSTFVFRHAPWT